MLFRRQKEDGYCGYPDAGGMPCAQRVVPGQRCPMHQMLLNGHVDNFGGKRSRREAGGIAGSIRRAWLPPLCIGVRASGKPCNARVDEPNTICDECWRDLLLNGSIAHKIEMTKEPHLPAECARVLATPRVTTGSIMFYMAQRQDNSPEVWQALATCSDYYVRHEVARSPYCPSAIIAQLVTDSHQAVRDQAIATMRGAQLRSSARHALGAAPPAALPA